MSHHTKLDKKFEGTDNFQAWKYRISLVLEENELDTYISGEVPVPEGDEAKSLHKKKLVKAKKIIFDSIMDQLVPHVSSLKTLNMFDSLTNLFEGKNINQKMALRKQLKNVKIQNAEQLEVVEEEVDNAEVVIATLNGLLGSWDSFMQRIYARRN